MKLTPRQWDTMRAIAPGLYTADAAATMNIASSGLEGHMRGASIRLELPGRNQTLLIHTYFDIAPFAECIAWGVQYARQLRDLNSLGDTYSSCATIAGDPTQAQATYHSIAQKIGLSEVQTRRRFARTVALLDPPAPRRRRPIPFLAFLARLDARLQKGE